MSGAAAEPRNLIERAAAAAADAVDAVLEAAGGNCARLYVAIEGEDLPPGELDCVAAASGSEIPEDFDERARAVFVFLIGEAVGVGKALGLDVKIVPLRGGPAS